MAPKIKIDKETAPEVETNVEEVNEEPKAATKQEWPEVGNPGKFVAVEFKDGYVVFNPSGQRATGIIDKHKADDIVRESNRAAGIKKR